VLHSDIDLLNPPAELEKQKHKLKRLVQSPNSFFMVGARRVQPGGRAAAPRAGGAAPRPRGVAVEGPDCALSPAPGPFPPQQDVKCQGCFNM
jgi:hypothetical protein